jgi:hypothetical protein
MATVNKDFKVKNGLIVEGATATVNNFDVLTKKTEDQNYIIGLIGGSATSEANANAVVLRDENASFSANVITATEFVGDVTGQVSDISNFDTDDLAEGENLYFTNARAQAAVADDITNAIDALDTDDIEEGDTNLYFTDQRALDATALAYDLVGSAANAQSAAEDYADSLAVNYDPAGEANTRVSAHNDLTSGVHGVTGNVVGTTDVQELSNKALGSNLVAATFQITGLGTPHNSADAATKGYVDSVAEGLHVHASVAVATTENIANLASPGATIDGVTLTFGMRVLVKDQTAAAENGIYFVDTSDSLVRADDYDTAGEIQAGDFVFVNGGDEYTATGWVQINPVNTLGTDPIEWQQFSGAGTYLAGYGLSLDGSTFEIDEEVVATIFYVGNAVANGIADATTDDLAEGSTNLYFTNARAQAAVADDITSAIDALDTDDIEEGDTNLYFTNARAEAAMVTTLTTGTQENITVTYANGVYNFVAENGVADSTTDDLVEGSSNLYFTNARAQAAVADDITAAIDALDTDDIEEGTSNLYFSNARAVDALEAVVPNFTEIDVNSVATQVAASVEVPTASTVTAYEFDAAQYRSAKFLVKFASGTHTEISEVLLTLDTSDNIAITEYALVGTNGNLGDVSADVFEGSVRLRVATINNNTDVVVMGTLLV